MIIIAENTKENGQLKTAQKRLLSLLPVDSVHTRCYEDSIIPTFWSINDIDEVSVSLFDDDIASGWNSFSIEEKTKAFKAFFDELNEKLTEDVNELIEYDFSCFLLKHLRDIFVDLLKRNKLVLVVKNEKGNIKNFLMLEKEFLDGDEFSCGAALPTNSWETFFFRPNITTDYRLCDEQSLRSFLAGNFHDGENECFDNLKVSDCLLAGFSLFVHTKN